MKQPVNSSLFTGVLLHLLPPPAFNSLLFPPSSAIPMGKEGNHSFFSSHITSTMLIPDQPHEILSHCNNLFNSAITLHIYMLKILGGVRRLDSVHCKGYLTPSLLSLLICRPFFEPYYPIKILFIPASCCVTGT